MQTQRYEVDCEETFALVAKLNKICILTYISTNRGLSVQQFDEENAFLNETLDEEVYIEIPPSVNSAKAKRSDVCKLKKSLYSLK